MNYGWIPSLPDIRDYKYIIASPVQLPDVVDLRPYCPPVYNQLQAGSCTANALAGGIEFDLLKQNKPYFMPSRLFIYFNERAIEGTTGSDSDGSFCFAVIVLLNYNLTGWNYHFKR